MSFLKHIDHIIWSYKYRMSKICYLSAGFHFKKIHQTLITSILPVQNESYYATIYMYENIFVYNMDVIIGKWE